MFSAPENPQTGLKAAHAPCASGGKGGGRQVDVHLIVGSASPRQWRQAGGSAIAVAAPTAISGAIPFGAIRGKKQLLFHKFGTGQPPTDICSHRFHETGGAARRRVAPWVAPGPTAVGRTARPRQITLYKTVFDRARTTHTNTLNLAFCLNYCSKPGGCLGYGKSFARHRDGPGSRLHISCTPKTAAEALVPST